MSDPASLGNLIWLIKPPFSGYSDKPFTHHVQAIEGSPYNKGPTGTMPKSADHECNKEVKAVPGYGDATAAQGDIEVVLKPG